jgi:hypothetical protein
MEHAFSRYGISFSLLMSAYNWETTILVALTARELNFDEFKSGELYEKYAVANVELWESSQHLLKEGCVEVAGRRDFRIHTDF